MDAQLWQRLAELHRRDDVRAIVWRGNGKSFSSGRDTAELGVRSEDISNLDFIERGHAGTQLFFSVPAPIVVALKGWVIGGSFERALLCDLRIAGESAKMMLPEVRHGVVPDSGGTARLFQMAGHGLAADLALTGRVMDAQEALRHGVVSRVVPDDELDATCLSLAREIASQSAFAVKMFRRTLARLADPPVRASLQEEAVSQTLVQASDDYAEHKAARAEGRDPVWRRR
jgi:enoyl-CoA hydratase/carnithine racemase